MPTITAAGVIIFFSLFFLFSPQLVEGNSFILSGIYLSFTNVKLLLSQCRCYNSHGVWQAIAPRAYHTNTQMHRHGNSHACPHTYKHTCKHIPCAGMSATVSSSHHIHIHISSSFPPLPPHPPILMQSLPRCCGLPVTVIEGSWPEQCEDGGGKKGRIGGGRDEKRKGGGNHSSETHGCGMAYYRSNV